MVMGTAQRWAPTCPRWGITCKHTHTHTWSAEVLSEHCGILFASKLTGEFVGQSLSFLIPWLFLSLCLVFLHCWPSPSPVMSKCEYSSVLAWTKEIWSFGTASPVLIRVAEGLAGGTDFKLYRRNDRAVASASFESWNTDFTHTHTHAHLAPCQRGTHSIRLIEPLKSKIHWLGRKRKMHKTEASIQVGTAFACCRGQIKCNVALPINSFSEAELGKSKFGGRFRSLLNQWGRSRCLIFEAGICVWWGHAWGKARMMQSTGMDEKESNQVLVQHFKLGTSRCHVEEHRKRVKQLR